MTDHENERFTSTGPSRRTFLIAGGAAIAAAGAAIAAKLTNAPALIGLDRKSGPKITGGWVNESAAIGHRIRDHASMPAPRRTARVPVVIVGGGIAGLSAAWQLDRKGFRDYVLLELERERQACKTATKDEDVRVGAAHPARRTNACSSITHHDHSSPGSTERRTG